MKSKLLLVLLAVSLLCGASPSYSIGHVPGEVIVVFKTPENGAVSVSACAASIGASVKKTYATLSESGGGEFVLLHSETRSEHELLEELRARPDVLAVSLNHKRKALADYYLPNDKYAESLWGMVAIRADELWSMDITGSSSVHVAVLDSGITPNHEDLRGNVSSYSRNFSGGSTLSDSDGHGTHVSGTIGAKGNNGVGVAGVNWNVQIISAGIMDKEGATTDALIIEALNYVLELLNQGVNIASVNLSLGAWEEYTPAQKAANDPLYRAMSQVNRTNKTIMCVAAGNEDQAVGLPAPCNSERDDDGYYVYLKGYYCYPASFTGLDNMIVVASMNPEGKRDSFENVPSNYDDDVSSHSNYNADIAAPGMLILSTFPEGYAAASGTSMATPHVSGAAALLKSQYPKATASQIRKAILDGANSKYCANDSSGTVYRDGLSHAQASTSENGLLDVRRALQLLPGIMENYDDEPGGDDNTGGDDDNSGGGTTVGGTVQTFTSMKVLVPEGWGAAENDDGDIVYLGSRTDKTLYINLLVSETNGATLRAIAEAWCEALEGDNLSQPSSTSGYYRFGYVNDSGNRCTVFIDDSTTDSRVPSGYYWLQLVSNAVDDDLFNTVLSSVVITVGGGGSNNGGGGNNNGGGNNGGGNNNGGGSTSSSGGGGGCSSFTGAVILLALAGLFRKHKA